VSSPDKLPVLLYHRVGPPRGGTDPSLTVSSQKFARQMHALKRWGYTAIAVEDWRCAVQKGVPLPPKPALITFDDAYEDLREHAFPLLERMGLRATVFVVTSEIGGQNSWDTARGHQALRLLDANAMRHWSQRGIEFGSHGHRHADMPALSPAEMAHEAMTSKAVLSDVLGRGVTSFAYPYGKMDEKVRLAVSREFAVAFTADPGLNTCQTDLLTLHRTMVQPADTLLDLWLRLRTGKSFLQTLRERLKLRTRVGRLLATERS
jgi:peptidoglycan/xylan/chitin deacetylase (PgdA/CDA1 family)